MNQNWIKIKLMENSKLKELTRKESKKEIRDIKKLLLKEYGYKLPKYMIKRIKKNKPKIVADSKAQEKAAAEIIKYYLKKFATEKNKPRLSNLFAHIIDHSFELDGAPFIEDRNIFWQAYANSEYFFSRDIDLSLNLQA